MTRFKAIFFDAAGTLLHAHPSVGHVYAEVVARYGPTVDPQTIDAAFRKTFAARRGGRSSSLTHEGYDWWRALVFDTLGSLKISVRAPDEFFRELYWRFAEIDVWRLFPDALPALLEARGHGFKIALISNWDVRLRRLVEGMAIAPLFDAIFISTEVGIEKPDPRIFRLACERLGVQPSEALHVGDNQREDIEGANSAGLRAFLLNRSASGEPDPGTIRDLRHACRLVQ
ncbi:MAG: HAD family hydrolase [Verrucomicrobiae bacterium]|nr:HAD family hydrolase [Verrucomicrobiae bacterium]